MEKATAAARILAVETSGGAFSVAAAERGDRFVLRGEVFLNIGLRHSEILAPTCKDLLDRCGWQRADLTHLAVSTGPGSFTGLRVGIAFTRALAQGLGIPLIGVSTFDLLASAFRRARQDPLCVCLESIGKEVFAAFYPAGRAAASESGVFPVEAVLESVRKRKLAVLGDALRRHPELARAGAQAAEEFQSPRAAQLARLAAERLSRKPKADSWRQITPLYLRQPVAMERLNYRKKKDKIGKPS